MDRDVHSGRARAADRPMARRVLSALAAVLIGVTAGLAAVEVILRLNGYQAWHYLGTETRELVVHEPDAQLGWRAKAGSYVFAPYAAGSPEVHLTFLPDGARVTHADGDGRADSAAPDVAFVGCSLTQGWAISDEETFAWRIQERFPSLRVRNYGTSGYGTYQSLLVMERLLSQPQPPRVVLYGFMEEHEPRNVADPNWLTLMALRSKQGGVATPYCTLAPTGLLTRHPPTEYPRWPLRESLATVTLLENRIVALRAGQRTAQARQVTEQLLIEMNTLATRHGVRFGVVLLHLSPEAKAHYAAFLDQHHVDFVDCAFPLPAAMQVPGDGHPNGRMNARWADCIGARLAADWAPSNGEAPLR